MTVTATEKPQPTQPQPQVGMTYDGFDVLHYAFSCLGLPYASGGKDPSTGFDCSGYVQYCYKMVGINIPGTPAGQKECGTKYNMFDAKPGDIIVAENGSSIHTALYTGIGIIYDATDTLGVWCRALAYDDSYSDTDTTRIYAVRPGNNTAAKSAVRY